MKKDKNIESIDLIPSLDACVQTQAKRLYNKTLSQLLESGENAALQKKLKLLTLFLETADFNKLRSESEKHLIDGKKVTFSISTDKDGITHHMKVE